MDGQNHQPQVWLTRLHILRVRLLITPQRQVSIPAHQSAMYYAMLCDAYASKGQRKPRMPDAVLLDAPDQARATAGPEDPLVMGLTIFGPDLSQLQAKVQELVDGLRRIGRHPVSGQRLSRFRVDRFEDLVAGKAVQTAAQLEPLAPADITRHIHQAQQTNSVRLNFMSPLRCQRPGKAKREGHGYFDDHYFQPKPFLSRLLSRLQRLGWSGELQENWSNVDCISNDLVWLDIGYGYGKQRKTLGGAVGTVALTNLPADVWPSLIWGQFLRLGENTRFGFGAFQVQPLGVDTQLLAPLPIFTRRSRSLLDGCLTQQSFDEVEIPDSVESGAIVLAVKQIVDGTYEVDPHRHFQIPKSDGSQRELTIPAERDRVLQRAVLNQLAPAIDQYLETSSVAYRRGLGQRTAARAIRKAYRSGYRWAVKADFESFFDTVDHSHLERRLRAYVADPCLVDLVMRWVRAGVPNARVGLPTGSPLSPLLANLFLDHFDEEITARGGKLVRYADDFMILCRSRKMATKLYEAAESEASELQLQLNQEKSREVCLEQPFHFLGCRFEPVGPDDRQWNYTSAAAPVMVEDLGWKPAKREKPNSETKKSRYELPGESEIEPFQGHTTVIAGPEVERIDVTGRRLRIDLKESGGNRSLPLANVEHLTVLGNAVLSWQAQRKLTEEGVTISKQDRAGGLSFEVTPGQSQPDHVVVVGQVKIANDDDLGLDVARKLISAKLHNYASLAASNLSRYAAVTRQLRDLAEKSETCDSVSSLLGLEGSGAAIWYGQFAKLLGRGFHFYGRVAPDAADPVNALLNLGQTVLHRLVIGAIQANGLVSTVGPLHRPRGRHATLASDLQEPFRHLVDRVVLEATHSLRPSDFVEDADDPYALKIQPRAMAKFFEQLHRTFAIPVAGHAQPEPSSYRRQIHKTALSYRRYCQDQTIEFTPFTHPRPKRKKPNRLVQKSAALPDSKSTISS